MATLELCDLCGGKVKHQFVNLSIQGKMQFYKGQPPEPPPGFKYQETEEEQGKTFIKTWDAYGKLVSEFHLMPKPKKWRDIRIKYEICEDCSQKMLLLLEQLRSKYHLEQKQIEVLNQPFQSPWKMLGFDEADNWRRGDDDDE